MSSNFSRPTLSELITRNQSDINASIKGADSRIRRSILSVLARMIAGMAHLLFGYLDWAYRQIFPDTSEKENLRRWAAIFGIKPKSATQASGLNALTGSNGSAINIGTVFTRGDGVQYRATSATLISGGIGSLTIQALVAGSQGNCDSGTQLTFISPISGVNAVTITGAITGGTDDESDDDLKTRLLARLRNPPQGGDLADYEEWALDVAGVTRAFPVRHESGIGTVTVRIMMDDTYPNGIPTSDDAARVKAHIETVRPVTAEVFVLAPTPIPLDFTIQLKNANGDIETSPAIRNAIAAELADMILRDAVPKGKILLSHINEAISVAAGEFDHQVTLPVADVTHSVGQIATMGTITWA